MKAYRMGRLAVLALMAAIAVECRAAASLVKNGGFEEVEKGRPVGWSLPPCYSHAPGMGRNGTSAIAFSSPTNLIKQIQPVMQWVKLAPGHVYRVSCWVRTEGVKFEPGHPGAKIGMEWGDTNGWHGCYSHSRSGTKDWTRLSFVSPQLPASLAKVRVQLYVGYGKATGKAWFDDFAIEEVVPKPISGLYADAYRGGVAPGDTLTLKGVVNLTPDQLAARTAQVTLHYTDAAGKPRAVPPSALRVDEVTFTLRVDELAPGRQDVLCTVVTNGIAAGQATCKVERFAKEVPWRVRFDVHQRAIVDGKPFFPLGMYMGKVTPEELAVFREGPFNCLMPYHEPSREMLDLCVEKKLKVIYPLKEVYYHTNWAKARKIKTIADEEAYVTGRVNTFKGHPAILAWYLNDEFGPEYVDRLAERRALFEKLDPDHPTWTCLYQYRQVGMYMDSLDCIGTDPYPVPKDPISRAVEWTLATRTGTRGVRPLWMIPQAMAWSWFKRKGPMPTRAEMRSMSWQMIAGGANGLIYYAFHQMRRNAGADFPRYWADVKAVAREVDQYAVVLLGDPGPETTCALPARMLPVRTWRKSGDVWLLAVNATAKPATAEVAVAGTYGMCQTVFGGQAERTPDGKLSLRLEPWDAILVRMN